ncbi:methyl-accepting chemotaxis protein [Salinibius halmophilus]|uniref:methyl-accepting chemotaxis protein n=1 Tax=Salinibius halmophilus TaxID=1853216 RepID=UPI000E671468|nr:methyl-accepting chemotaxis protein [Salinibius halmophilus]
MNLSTSLSSLLRNKQSSTIISLVAALLAALVVLIALFYFDNKTSSEDRVHLSNVADLQVLSQQLAKNATEAADGRANAFDFLLEERNHFAGDLQELKEESTVDGDYSPALDSSIDMRAVDRLWVGVRLAADQIVASESYITEVNDYVLTVEEELPLIRLSYNDVVAIIQQNGIDNPRHISIAQDQILVIQQMLGTVAQMLDDDDGAITAADDFTRYVQGFTSNLNAQINGDPSLDIEAVIDPEAREVLEIIQEDFNGIRTAVTRILDRSPELFQVREAAQLIYEDSEQLLGALQTLEDDIQAMSDSRPFGLLLTIAIAVAVLLMAAIAAVIIRGSTQEQKQLADENERNQNAILRLLDELADLADGDLTAQATVTEDFTGAIADSINYAIDQMRQLVGAINATAVQVSSAAQETQSTAVSLAESAENQAQEIAGASAAINEMAVSIDQVSANANESAMVAERAVGIAKKGADVVQNTINGMDTIREQIQDTSKRIKRLGESSQEIGDIVSLINDIADQTNILALNAAIQASMAGDAGRGFAVVADEVQRLAERSSAATKQIEALVKTIQSDTNEAVISMESTTSEVVRGARLAQDAGVALEEIENVSKSLAELIQNISNAARQQASSAGHISNTMNVIQDITSQTSAGTMATARSIGDLAGLASEMRASVAGFKLPELDAANQ